MTFKINKNIPPHELLRTCVGTGLGIGGVALLADLTGFPLIIAPFGASAVLLYSAVSSPLAQPKNLILGHMISGFIAISCCNLNYSMSIGIKKGCFFLRKFAKIH